MPATPISHIGILVHDLEAAKVRFSQAFGIDFQDTVQFSGVQFARGEDKVLEAGAYAFSVEGPVFLELLQSQDNDGVYSRDRGEGVHHLAMLVPDTAEHLEHELAPHGLHAEYEITLPGEGCMLAAYLDPADVHGCRIELLNRVPGILGVEEQAIVEAALGLSNRKA